MKKRKNFVCMGRRELENQRDFGNPLETQGRVFQIPESPKGLGWRGLKDHLVPRVGLGNREKFFPPPEGAGHCPGSPGNAGDPGGFGQCSQRQAGIVGASVQEQELH